MSLAPRDVTLSRGPHSERRATIGSTFVARHEGRQHASRATARIRLALTVSVSASVAHCRLLRHGFPTSCSLPCQSYWRRKYCRGKGDAHAQTKSSSTNADLARQVWLAPATKSTTAASISFHSPRRNTTQWVPSRRVIQIGSMRKAGGLPHSFGLKQMTALMLRDDFQARANSKTQQRDERILESDAVHIVVACSPDQLSGRFVTPKKGVQDEGFYLPAGFYLLGCPGTGPTGVGSNVGANEPTAEPAETDFVDCSRSAAIQSSRNRGQVDFVSKAQMLQALAYTPRTLPRLPIELNSVESSRHTLAAAIGGIQLGDEAHRPIGQNRIAASRHSVRITSPSGWGREVDPSQRTGSGWRI